MEEVLKELRYDSFSYNVERNLNEIKEEGWLLLHVCTTSEYNPRDPRVNDIYYNTIHRRMGWWDRFKEKWL